VRFPERVFREYDIRGIVDEEITPALAKALGRAYAAMLAADETRAVAVGRDVRASGKVLMDALIEGLNESGVDVLDLGMVPTPLAYFAAFACDAAGCIEVTASHNPPQYNGFKMMLGRDALHGEGIQRLRAAIEEGRSRKAARQGRRIAYDIRPQYIAFVEQDCKLSRPLRVVVDGGNGAAGEIAVEVYRRLGCKVEAIFCEPDGRFPNHHPDPTVDANLKALIEKVRASQADCGIAFDGDGDRIGVVDETGAIVRGDMLLLILARRLLQDRPGATIISEVKCSERLYADLRARGANAIMWKTGHSPIKAKMKQTGALLAGEMSGHLFFADRYYGFDDAIYAGARLLQVLAEAERPLSRLLEDLPPAVSTPELRIDCADEEKFAVVEQAKAHFRAEGFDVIEIDGARVRFSDGAWGLIRASNTQPALVLRFEAPNEARLEEVQRLFFDWLRRVPSVRLPR